MPPAPSTVGGAGVYARLGGRRVRYGYRPGAGPTVILLGGCAVPSTSWAEVVSALPGTAAAWLDRPGLLGTPWPDRLPRLVDEVRTLVELIPVVGGRPAVVVAHSMAGLHAEALAREHPELVGALILVDGSLSWTQRRSWFGPGWRVLGKAARRLWQVSIGGRRVVAALGPLTERILIASQSRRQGVFARRSATDRAVFRRGDAVASVIAEQGAYRDQLRDLARIRLAHPMPDIPVVVITAGAGARPRWLRDQARLADLLGGRQLVVPDARHLIMYDSPEVIAEAINEIVHRLRADEDHPRKGEL